MALPLLAFFLLLCEVAMVLVYVNFKHATINGNTLSAQQIRMMNFGKIARKGSTRIFARQTNQ
jgi:hypothetical protein